VNYLLNTKKIRQDFPLFKRKINGKKIIYFDSACMSLKPKQVIEKISEYYSKMSACAGRSNHTLGNEVTFAVEQSRKTIQKFIKAKSNKEIIFTKNTTESINLVANSFGLKKGDKILLSDKEHNSGLLPFQKLLKNKIKLDFFEFGNEEDFKEKIKNTKLVSFIDSSNIDGTTQNSKKLINIAHEFGTKVLIDGAQTIPHKKINIQKIDADFLAFSGHKMLGPTGTGILYGKEELLKKMDQFIVGGETVKNSTYSKNEIEDLPHKFEGGLQNYAGIIGLGEAINYLTKIGMNNIYEHEKKLNKMITKEFENLEENKITIISNKKERGGIISFNINGFNTHDVAGILNESSNIMVRTGNHCCHSWFNAHKINGSIRASFYLYNTKEECKKLIEEIKNIINLQKI
jgi:cysteine desulfurase / selenocysteine lyase